jgi:Tfp pilus assembly protein PilF
LEGRYTVPMARLSVPRAAKKELDQARVLLNKNDVAAAIGRLEKAVEIAPQFAAAWNSLGVIAAKSGRYEDAELDFRKALAAEPGTYVPSVNLGGVLLKLARPDEAFKYNLMATGARPHSAQAVAQMGINCMILGMHDYALTYLKEAKRLDPGSASFPQLFLARIYLQRSDRTAAIGELEDFLARHPDTPEAREARLNLEKLRAQ